MNLIPVLPVVFLLYNSYGCGDREPDFLGNWRNLGTKSGLTKSDVCPEWSASVAHSSRGLGHLPLKEEITGSNPVCATNSVNI